MRLPVQLQRVMAAEAEASREARAKVRMPITCTTAVVGSLQRNVRDARGKAAQ